MCIICAKKAGISMPTDETLRIMWNNNSDGAGIMWAENDMVNIAKGFMTFESFKKFLNGLSDRLDLKETSMVMHFRIETHGGVKPENCHPFPISDNVANLQKLMFKTDLGVAHNGIIHTVEPSKGISDTMEYILSHLSIMKKIDKSFYRKKNWQELIYTDISSRMAFLDNKGKIYTVGDFIDEKGLLYSCSSYKPHIYNYSYKSYIPYASYGWNDDYYLPSGKTSEDFGLDYDVEYMNNKAYMVYPEYVMPVPDNAYIVDDITGDYFDNGQYYIDEYNNLYKRDDDLDGLVMFGENTYTILDGVEYDIINYDISNGECQSIYEELEDGEVSENFKELFDSDAFFEEIKVLDSSDAVVLSTFNTTLGRALMGMQHVLGEIVDILVWGYSEFTGTRYWIETKNGSEYIVSCDSKYNNIDLW